MSSSKKAVIKHVAVNLMIMNKIFMEIIALQGIHATFENTKLWYVLYLFASDFMFAFDSILKPIEQIVLRLLFF